MRYETRERVRRGAALGLAASLAGGFSLTVFIVASGDGLSLRALAVFVAAADAAACDAGIVFPCAFGLALAGAFLLGEHNRRLGKLR